MSNYLPTKDADLDQWGANFNTEFSSTGVSLGFLPADVSAVSSAYGSFHSFYLASLSAREAAKAATQSKAGAQQAFETLARGIVRRLQAAPGMNNTLREQYRITVPDPSRTPPPPPTTRPTATVDLNNRLEHTLRIADETTPQSRSKPDGVVACEIWRKIGGTPPVDASECQLVIATPQTRDTLDYDGADGNKTAYYLLRWSDLQNRKGPWSDTIAATIAA